MYIYIYIYIYIYKTSTYFYQYIIYFKYIILFTMLVYLLLCYTLLHFIDAVFLQIKGLWQLDIEQVCWCHFSLTFIHFMFLCHILVILTIFQTFKLLLFLLWWSVITDFWFSDDSESSEMLSIFSNKIQFKVFTLYFYR